MYWWYTNKIRFISFISPEHFYFGITVKFYSRSQSVLRVRNIYLINFAEISECFFIDIYVWRIQIFFSE